jgi:hypothetical protein
VKPIVRVADNWPEQLDCNLLPVHECCYRCPPVAFVAHYGAVHGYDNAADEELATRIANSFIEAAASRARLFPKEAS